MDLYNTLLIFLMTIFLAAIASIVIQTIFNGISPMPSTNRIRTEMLKLAYELPIPNNIIDLGSGWGNLSFAFSRAFPLAKVIGYENSFIPYLFTVCLKFIFKYNNLQFYYQNFLKISLRKADLVVCYLFPGGMKRLNTKFEQELKPGAIVISNTFALSEKQPFKIVTINDIYHTKIYCYRF